MVSVYAKLVIANYLGKGGRTIDNVPANLIVDVAVAVIRKGYEDGKTYITVDDVPEKYRQAVMEIISL